MSEILDSGERRTFQTGAVRDMSEGKGRCDLLPLETLGKHFTDSILENVGKFVYSGDVSLLVDSLHTFLSIRKWDFSTAVLEVAIHYENGAKKYVERNWEKGIPLHSYIDSAIRHYLKYQRGDNDEPHDRAFVWNILCAIWTVENKPEFIDLPFGDTK